MTVYILLVGIAAAAVVYVFRLAFPPAPALARQVHAWGRDRAEATRRAARAGEGTRGQRWVALGVQAVERRRPDLVRSFNQDLEVTGQSREAWLTRTVAVTLTALMLPLAFLPLLVAYDSAAIPAGTALAFALALACMTVVVSLRELNGRATARREEFRRGLSLFLDLVVMSMEAGRGHAEALPTVAGVGDGWVFRELRSAVASARTHGITPWSALGRVGERMGIVELLDLQASVELAQEEGGRIRDSLVSRASSMRAVRAVDLQARAATRTEAMRNTLVLMALLTAAYVITARLLYLVNA
ncbi:type II secretion system F family protein [Nocardioides dongkuii]|uniref:type II secretion system F family protein n=1 Tax=Nocardioides dongkuii TaxID=2760089 RepID=UPI0018780285|nr:type II secretion system F family protein [Nocardioides dongkuii]